MTLFRYLRILSIILLSACANKKGGSVSTDATESAQQVGEAMASADEMGGSTGSISFWRPEFQGATFSFGSYLSPISNANATSCFFASTFGSCSAGGVITRTFNSCTISKSIFTGTVTLTWSGGAPCTLGSVGENIRRVPNFTITAASGATLSVSKAAVNGQILTWTSGTGTSTVFSLSNDGIRRIYKNISGTTVYDHTTTITSNITVTGTNRSSRTMTGGTLHVLNNLTNIYCDYTPTNLQWTTGCNCPVSGDWSGTCSDGKNTALTISSCGKGTITVGSTTETITFDRCGS